jgi:hypothetical protein
MPITDGAVNSIDELAAVALSRRAQTLHRCVRAEHELVRSEESPVWEVSLKLAAFRPGRLVRAEMLGVRPAELWCWPRLRSWKPK